MKVEELVKLGASEEVAKEIINKRFKGKFVSNDRIEEVRKETEDTYKEKLTERDNQLKELESLKDLTEEQKQTISTMQETNKENEKKFQAEIAATNKKNALTHALKDAGARNIKPVMALLDADKVKLDDDTLIGLDEQLKGIKESDPYLFNDEIEEGEDEPSINLKGANPADSKGNGTDKPLSPFERGMAKGFDN